MVRRSLPGILLFLFWLLAMTSAVGDSPTMDEQNHIARGLAFLRTGDPRLSIEHPPLVNVLSALPLLTMPVRLPTDDWSWQAAEWYRFADLLLWHSGNDAEQMVFLARIPIMFLSLLLAASIFRLCRAWFGDGATGRRIDPALLTLTLYVLDPNVLAHSRYSTTDLGAAAFVFWAIAALWWAGRRGFATVPVVLAGCAWGLALSSKLSTLVFVPIVAVLVVATLARRWSADRKQGWQAALRLCLLFPVSSLLVVWAVFGFDFGSVIPGGPAVPLPLFWRGIDTMLAQSGGGRPAFLLGHFSSVGFRAFFPVALAIKTPLPTLLLLGWAGARFVHRLWQGGWRRPMPGVGAALFLLLPAMFYFGASTLSALNLGYRHLLPILPLLFAFSAGQLADLGAAAGPGQTRVAIAAIALSLGWLLVANLAIYPYYLGYFNEIVGPKNGYRVLVDSNVDWGQDLKRLKAWMDRAREPRIHLAWFGSAPPSYYGIAYDPLPGLPHHFDLWEKLPFDPESPEPGTYAISVSVLQELYRRDEDKTAFAWFRARMPDDRVGCSVMIYRVSAP